MEAKKGVESSTITASSKGTSANTMMMDGRFVFGLGAGIPTFLLAWGIFDENSPPAKFANMIGLTDQISSFTDEYTRPNHAKLLPDWGDIPNVPKDMATPHTLVIDLENTLVNSTWDRKYGWRHAKRPGVDQFLSTMAQYYEIVVYSPSVQGLAEPVLMSLDKNGCIMHRLYREATHYINGVYCKDLNSLNRNVNRIVYLDDDPAAAKLNPENLIPVKPYQDPSDRNDNTLERITPFLVEIAREEYNDVPELLRQFQGMDADAIADELERRVEELRFERQKGAERGLGAFSMAGKRDLPQPELTPELQNKGNSSPAMLSSKDLVGEAPEVEQTGVAGWFKRRQIEQEEQQMRKMEKWNEIMMKKQMEKKKAEDEARAQNTA
eukprot:CAMPEP_0197826688 /NCGR_PEP_ID=MMETSP1437-20131217/3605_1 /TAXON_ID=49252 ORGANISM="Eucampia antarctica, Strain CCMP1452" /NCGR_SAMPLE_ID=MMETSP1437 /ASSEMBLY_ACC=CAM_ASM_001096 /LENGTH=380 /DNA_ID=CAMNT_0043427225 /DNA_START=303 /DNA_END=1445 /DNA_ORIENTATION=-